MLINEHVHSLNDRVQWEFKSIESHLVGKGVDVGCGTNRLSPEIISIDEQPNKKYAHADIVHNCKDLEINKPIEWSGEVYSFKDEDLDFIFSSHCLEDFDNIPVVFMNWWKKLKPNGLMILLLPDMEKCDCDLCTSESNIAAMKKDQRDARYWTIEDYKLKGKGNPAHKTNVGKKFMTSMFEQLKINHEIVQIDTLPHNKTCTIDMVIKKL